jgi:hypothetical membrane protein
MTWWGWGLLVLGLMVLGMGLLDRRWGNKGWLLRTLTGLAVALAGLYYLLTA